jgi:cytoskeletal protein CcmA (bactofilin family)
MAYIGKTVVVKGELSGKEDLYLDGEVEGTVELRDHNLTVGPNGRVKANLHAKDITIIGKVQGNVRAIDKVEIRKSGSLIGDIITARPIIEEGAYVKGSIETQRAEVARAEARKAETAAAAAAPSSHAGFSTGKKLP